VKKITIIAALVASLLSSYSIADQVVAVRLTADNLAQYRLGGSDAIAGVDDWVLSNGILCAAVSDQNHDTGLTGQGGVLIDVGYCGRSDDQWTFNHLMINIDQYRALNATNISMAKGEDWAALIVEAQSDGINVVTTYTLGKDAEVLDINYLTTRTKEGDAVPLLGVLTMHVHRSITPFVLSTSHPSYSSGFKHIDFSSDDRLSAVEAMLPADTIIFEGAQNLSPSISYGLQLTTASLETADGEMFSLPRFAQAHSDYTLQGIFTQQPWLGGEDKLGLLEFAQSQFMDIAIGDKVTMQKKLWLSKSGDVAGITDQIFAGSTVSGSVDQAGARLLISRLDGAPITTVVTDAQGNYAVKLPQGLDAIKLEVKTQWQSLSAKVIAINSGAVVVDKISTTKPSRIELSSSAPVRLVFKGVNGTLDPLFNNDLVEFAMSDILVGSNLAVNYVSLSGQESAAEAYAITAGEYAVYATRGLEYGLTKTKLTIEQGETISLVARLPSREVNSDGWLSSDFHVHSAPSFDTKISVRQRLKSFVAQGGDVMVGSEHNIIYAYENDITAENLGADIAVIAGTELTSLTRTPKTPYSYGHANVFPMQFKQTQYSGGLLKHEGNRIRELIDMFGSDSEHVILQMNHARKAAIKDDDSYYLDHLVAGNSYAPGLPLSSDNNKSLIEKDPNTGLRDIDIDLLEIANGSFLAAFFTNYEVLRQDWFSFLQQGEIIFASANSDSHGNVELVAMPRNYVYVGDDNLANFNRDTFINAISDGQMFGSSGPLITVSEQVGEIKTAQAIGVSKMLSGSDVSLQVTIAAASWVPLDTLKIYVNGVLEETRSVAANSQQDFEFNFSHDSFVIFEVTGQVNELYSLLAPTLTPMAFTNPVFIDADNDGKWNAPGLPQRTIE
jgi:hypothetical protein